jgi:hypothetical protein
MHSSGPLQAISAVAIAFAATQITHRRPYEPDHQSLLDARGAQPLRDS